MFNYGTNLDVMKMTNLAIGQENDFGKIILIFYDLFGNLNIRLTQAGFKTQPAFSKIDYG
jgi:hypothetical protein